MIAKSILLAAGLIVGYPFLAASGQASTARLTSDAQVVSGWGCFQQRGLEDQPASTQRLFYDLGMTYVRMELRPECGTADGSVDQAEMDHLVAQIRMAARYGVSTYILSVWSPPDVMKSPDQTHLGKSMNGGAEHLNPAYEARYVSYLTTAIVYLKAHCRKPPAAISVQNEPDAEPEPWDGCRYIDTPANVRLWRDVVVKLRASLDAHKCRNVEILGPETSKCGNGVTLLSPATALPLGGIAYHSYDVSQASALSKIVGALGKPVWMTEWSDVGQHDDLVATVDAVRRMCSDLVDMRTNYWTWWYGWRQWNVFDGEELLITQNDGQVRTTRLYSMYRELWSNVRPGWRVVPMTSDDPDLAGSGNGRGWPQAEMVAFRNPSHSEVVILIANPTKSAKTLTFAGLQMRARKATVFDWTNVADASTRTIDVTDGVIRDVSLAPGCVRMYVTTAHH